MRSYFTIVFIHFIAAGAFSVCALAAGDARIMAEHASSRKTPYAMGEKLQDPATSYMTLGGGEQSSGRRSDFDEFNNVDDPLYREGSKILLKRMIKEDALPKAAVKNSGVPAKQPGRSFSGGKPELMRDAPAEILSRPVPMSPMRKLDGDKVPVFPAKKNRLIKLVPADPVKAKSTL
jgi:hypothetical protein